MTELFEESNWISAFAGFSAKAPGKPAPFFRKTFQISELPSKAEVYFCGLGYSELYLNGKKVDDCVLQPVVNQYDKHVSYLRYDVTDLLRKGENVFGAVLGNGWYNFNVANTWKFETASWRGNPVMLLDFYCDGERVIVSDHTWKCLPNAGPIRYDSLHGGETYDARNGIPGWSETGFDDSSWESVKIADAPPGELTEQTMPGCKVMQRLAPISATNTPFGDTIYDFGQNITGWVKLRVKGESGSKITILYSELANDMHHLIDRKNIDVYINAGERFQQDEYILNGSAEPEEWEPRFTYHGFRFAKVQIEGAAEILEISGSVVHTDFEFLTEFESSSPVLNQLHKMTHWSFIDNYTGIPTDCPHREKNGWTGDACLASDYGLFHYDIESCYHHWINILRDTQRPSGQFPGIAPTNGWGYDWGNGPLYDTTIILIPWAVYRYTGKMRMLEENYDNMKKYIKYMKRKSVNHIVSWGLGDWCPVNWKRMTAIPLTSTGYYYGTTVVMSKIAKILGKEEDAVWFRDLAEKIRNAFQEAFYSGAGIYTEKTEPLRTDDMTALATALYWGICPETERAATASRLNQAAIANRYRADFGMFGAKMILRALAESGYTETAYRIITQPAYPGWVDWINHGATTLWETWKGDLSQTHIAYGDISAWMIQYLGGITPSEDAPGFSKLTIKPFVPEDLEFLTISTKLACGKVIVNWKQKDGKFQLDLTIPEGVPCQVILPDGNIHDQKTAVCSYECMLK